MRVENMLIAKYFYQTYGWKTDKKMTLIFCGVHQTAKEKAKGINCLFFNAETM